MNTLKNRPVITGDDSPQTVYNALRHNVGYLNRIDAPSHLPHRAHNAYETLADDFMIVGDEMLNPDGESVLWDMSNDTLEDALVAYGCDLLTQQPEGTAPEILAIDGLLKEIDRIKSR
jgi:hypothetical protein